MITLLSTAGDPWLTILHQSNDPFRELTGLLLGIEKGLKTFAEESMKEDLRRIEDIGSLIMYIIDQHERLTLSLNIQQRLSGVEHKIDGMLNRQKAKEIGAWLTPLDHSSVQEDKLEQRVGDTGRWFLESLTFQSWVDGSGKFPTLWCPGSPDTGKTILASIVVDHLCRQFVEENIPVLCVFGDWQNADAKTALSIIRNLLKQHQIIL
ncbi:hypothetical protein DFS33DRAFT_1387715 [Desarmillaria ectypa]|nr:hypothetical protein DFS33DRAFT_1387715 [Desarmillaria ectypa]